MSQLSMTDDGDIYIENNRFKLVDRKAEIRQRLIQNLRTFFTEWFLDTTLGVPYHQVIFEKGTPISEIESLIIDEILKTNGVENLIEFKPLDLDPANRGLSVDFEVATVFGSISVETLVP
jgi:hypothetical protein